MTDLPYLPVMVLPSTTNEELIYILQPPTSSILPAQLLLLNTSTTINSTTLPYITITKSLPFFENGLDVDYIPTMDSTGNIYVYAGKCDGEVDQSSLWLFQPSDQHLSGSAGWTKIGVSRVDSGNTENLGANRLAGGIAFSTANTTSDIYVFGGMCPDGNATNVASWTQSATYSNSMLALKQDGSASSSTYSLSTSSSRGPPIPEAGFTMTPLLPSFAQSDDGNQTQRISQNYVTLGGHTQTAFINMSQVALFSLPEESWTFSSVAFPGQEPGTALAVRDSPAVEPRSGHTAILTADGSKIVVYGGWVGDVNTAAHPQLIVLEVGKEYGGAADWQWSIPNQNGVTSRPGTGLYGHGAAMLPGNVMMIIGGYSIPGSSSQSQKRSGLVQNTDTYFFNATSSTWTSQYTHPHVASKHSASANSSSESVATSKRAGLGAGLAFGILALIAIVVLYFWYARHLKRKREAREEDLRNLGSGGRGVHLSAPGNNLHDSEMALRDSENAYPWGYGYSAAQADHEARATPQAQRTGLLFEIPSPTRGLRRSLHSRGAYQPAPRYDDGRPSRNYGNIHPIDERDEYEEGAQDHPSSARAEYHILQSAPVLDPFPEAGEGSRTPSPQSPARERELEIQRWVNDWAAADARMHQQAGRLSPDKTDRTSSTLSEQSMRSNWSGHSIGSFSRSLSQRSAALFSHAHPSTNPNTALLPGDELRNATQATIPRSTNYRRSQSLTLIPRRVTIADARTTGAASMRQLQQESEALLGGYTDAGPSSPTKHPSRARGWMGSMRRAFGTDRSASTSPDHGGSSTSSSPTKLHHETGVPRRAVSAGAALWRKRQGAKDWEGEGGRSNRETRPGAGPRQDDEEWDVESAVERRVVQVMFTVPREKLRVVNGAPEADADSILSGETKEGENAAESKEKGKGKDVSGHAPDVPSKS
ncbi:MAG: hypothetical protein Q9220_003968 [cf. Caloplaca sp. 1 TL-2023]